MRALPPVIRMLRPKQWLKSGFVFAPLLFAFQFYDIKQWGLSLLAFIAFVAISCVVYIINDLSDREEDRAHPVKSLRPIASGEVREHQALQLAGLLMLLVMAICLFLPVKCFMVIAAYLVINLFYTKGLKHVAIVDVLIIASGFVLRILMGGYAIKAAISPWIILSTFVLALFLGFGKRLHELGMDENYLKKRGSLEGYNKALLDKLISICCGAAMMSYALYATEVANRTQKVELVYTVAFVAFGLFRYLQYIYHTRQGGEPESIIYKDRWFFTNLVVWLCVTLWILY